LCVGTVHACIAAAVVVDVGTAHACVLAVVVVHVVKGHAYVVAAIAVLLLAEVVHPCVLALQLTLLMLVLLLL
jgi:hypothetical protein